MFPNTNSMGYSKFSVTKNIPDEILTKDGMIELKKPGQYLYAKVAPKLAICIAPT